MATVETLLTAEEFRLLPDDGPPMELVRGKIETMNMPAPRHGYLCNQISSILTPFVKQHHLGRVMVNDSCCRVFGSSFGKFWNEFLGDCFLVGQNQWFARQWSAGLGLALAMAGLGADWPGFRGPGGMGLGQGPEPPLRWSAKENILWKVKLPGPGASSPIVWKDQVLVTCYSLWPGQGPGGVGQPASTRRDPSRLRTRTGERPSASTAQGVAWMIPCDGSDCPDSTEAKHRKRKDYSGLMPRIIAATLAGAVSSPKRAWPSRCRFSRLPGDRESALD